MIIFPAIDIIEGKTLHPFKKGVFLQNFGGYFFSSAWDDVRAPYRGH